MRDQKTARVRRLTIWFTINLVIFILCYLNYRLQLKHRYLYKILNIGLCLSRAAAMVINFNLLLVWLPMCKYTLTRLACFASIVSARERSKLNNMLMRLGKEEAAAANCTSGSAKDDWRLRALIRPASRAIKRFNCYTLMIKCKSIDSFLVAVDHSTSLHTICATTITLASVVHTLAHLMNVINFSQRFDPFLSNLNMAEFRGQNPFQLLVSVPGITGIVMIVILLLMSLSSTQIIRNCSFDLFQIFHKLSIVFVVLLLLHPSSHVLKEQINVDRHHPEFCYSQSDASLLLDVTKTTALVKNHSATAGASERATSLSRDIESKPTDSNRSLNLQSLALHGAPTVIKAKEPETTSSASKNISISRTLTGEAHSGLHNETQRDSVSSSDKNISSKHKYGFRHRSGSYRCQDSRPTFVAQSSICWYVLSVGLSFYLLDLLLRRFRRSKGPIELLEAKTLGEGNLVELVFCNNHKRFKHWLPGQFVYLNCPQISRYEWHPFTISSMDNDKRLFTLHIKTGGDWTRKLKAELNSRRQTATVNLSCTTINNSAGMASLAILNQLHHTGGLARFQQDQKPYWPDNVRTAQLDKGTYPKWNHYDMVANDYYHTLVSWGDKFTASQRLPRLPMADCFDCTARSGCMTQGGSERTHINDAFVTHSCAQRDEIDSSGQLEISSNFDHCFKLDLSNFARGLQVKQNRPLDLYVDGPFHSPFERLLKQQVSVCISNGVGWTAFSSVFQKISSIAEEEDEKKLNLSVHGNAVWWSKWSNFATKSKSENRCHHHHRQHIQCWTKNLELGLDTTIDIDATTNSVPADTNVLHLIVIVTTIEQMRPFYKIVSNYFKRQQAKAYCDLCQKHTNEKKSTTALNYVREITVFITRSTSQDESVGLFCNEENLKQIMSKSNDDIYQAIRVNERFEIRFGKPNFDDYLRSLKNVYADRRKISVYCCGSYQVKQMVKDVCYNLNDVDGQFGCKQFEAKCQAPFYCYHEENF